MAVCRSCFVAGVVVLVSFPRPRAKSILYSILTRYYRETTCFIVGSFGIVPLAVHSIAYNVIPMVFMGAVGLATGLAVRIGQELSHNVQRAKRIAAWCMGFAIMVGLVVATLLYWLRESIIGLFTNDEQVFQVCLRSCVFHSKM